MTIYEDYAEVYDESGQLAFSLRMIPYLGELLERHPVQGRTLLDLACGTGTVAIGFALTGWRVYGVDGSARMLAQARAKAEQQGAEVRWSQQDMRRVVLPEQVDLATCLYDSLNYMLTSEDLSAVFRRVYRTLRPGGLFIFDMNTAWALATVWNDVTYFTDSEDLSVIFESKYDARRQRAAVLVVCFRRTEERAGTGLYTKIAERHTEQAYPPEQIATLLVDVGFQIEASYDCFTFNNPSPTSTRIMWVARRPGSPRWHASEEKG